MATNKITNKLFVWGNVISDGTSDVADIDNVISSSTKAAPGAQPGELVYADYLNAGIRSGSLISYSLIEALKTGPVGVTTDWLSLTSATFDYKETDTNISSAVSNLNIIINDFIKNVKVNAATNADNATNTSNADITELTEDVGDATVSFQIGEGTAYTKTINNVAHATSADEADEATSATNVTITKETANDNVVKFSIGTGLYEKTINNVDNATLADKATKLNTSRKINGTSFDGTSAITTAKWGTARDFYISDADGTNTSSSAISVDGSENVTLILPSTIKADITGNVTGNLTGNVTGDVTGNVTGNLTGNASSATNVSITKETANDNVVKFSIGTGSYQKTINNVSHATSADSADEANHASSADYATEANAATKLKSSVGSNIQPIYLSNGVPYITYMKCGKTNSNTFFYDGSVYKSASNSRTSTYSVYSAASVVASGYQMSDKIVILNINVSQINDVEGDRWLRFDLRSMASYLNLSSSTSIADHYGVSVVVTPNAKSDYTLGGDPSSFITYCSGQYLYVGLDNKNNASLYGLGIHVAIVMA